MKTITETAIALKAYGKKLPKPLSYTWTFEAFETLPEMVEAKATFTDAELVELRYAKDNANARSKSYQKALDDAGIVRPTAENDPQFALREMFKNISAQKLPDGSRKFTDEQARERASAALGIDWEDGE